MDNYENGHKEIVDKVNNQTFDMLREYMLYLIKFSQDGGAPAIYEYCKGQVPYIETKPITVLTKEEKLILMLNWLFSEGVNDYRATPFRIIDKLTDAELVTEFNRRLCDPNTYVRIHAEAVVSEEKGFGTTI